MGGPEAVLERYLFGVSDIEGGDCDGESRVVFGKRKVQLEPDEVWYPESYEDFMANGAPRYPAEVKKPFATAVGCRDYQSFAALGANILACDNCPLKPSE